MKKMLIIFLTTFFVGILPCWAHKDMSLLKLNPGLSKTAGQVRREKNHQRIKRERKTIVGRKRLQHPFDLQFASIVRSEFVQMMWCDPMGFIANLNHAINSQASCPNFMQKVLEIDDHLLMQTAQLNNLSHEAFVREIWNKPEKFIFLFHFFILKLRPMPEFMSQLQKLTVTQWLQIAGYHDQLLSIVWTLFEKNRFEVFAHDLAKMEAILSRLFHDDLTIYKGEVQNSRTQALIELCPESQIKLFFREILSKVRAALEIRARKDESVKISRAARARASLSRLCLDSVAKV